MSRISLLIVDDHPVVRAGLHGMFDSDPGFAVLCEAASGEAAVDAVREARPYIVLMDLQMPGIGGVEAIRRIRALPGPPPVLVLTTYDTDAQILSAIEAGAAGYLLKDTPRDALFDAVRSVVAGGSPLAPTVAARLLQRLPQAFRTARCRAAHESRARRPPPGGARCIEPGDRARPADRRGHREVAPPPRVREAGRGRPDLGRDDRHRAGTHRAAAVALTARRAVALSKQRWYLTRQRATLVVLANTDAQPLDPVSESLQRVVLEHQGA